MTFGCSWTRAIRFGMLEIRVADRSSQTIEQWLGDRMREREDPSKACNPIWTICMTTCWHIWKARCRAMFEAKIPQPGIIILEINATIDELMQLPNQRLSTPTANGEGKWTAPQPRTIQVNCDASWCKQTGMGGVSVIAHNSNGEVVGGINR